MISNRHCNMHGFSSIMCLELEKFHSWFLRLKLVDGRMEGMISNRPCSTIVNSCSHLHNLLKTGEVP